MDFVPLGSVLPKDRVASLLDKDGYFYLTESEAAAKADPKQVELEITAQIERARAAFSNASRLSHGHALSKQGIV